MQRFHPSACGQSGEVLGPFKLCVTPYCPLPRISPRSQPVHHRKPYRESRLNLSNLSPTIDHILVERECCNLEYVRLDIPVYRVIQVGYTACQRNTATVYTMEGGASTGRLRTTQLAKTDNIATVSPAANPSLRSPRGANPKHKHTIVNPQTKRHCSYVVKVNTRR